jgi:hypothetical protein
MRSREVEVEGIITSDSSKPKTEPIDEANGPSARKLQRVCHDTLPWLISFSLDRSKANCHCSAALTSRLLRPLVFENE